jgi:hypothetical protein
MLGMTKRFGAFAFLCLLTSSSFAAVAVTGNLKDLTGTAVTSRTFVRFNIRNCGGNQPKKAGTGVIVPNFYDLTPSGSGVISGTLYDNSEILCGLDTNTWYGVVIWRDGKPGPEVAYVLPAGSFNLNSGTPTDTVPTPSVGIPVLQNPIEAQTVTQPGSTRLTVNRLTVTDCIGCGGAPGGSDTQVQFNDGGTVFGGAVGLTWDKTNNLAVASALVTGTDDAAARQAFGYYSSQYPIAGLGTAPLRSIADVSDAHPGDMAGAVTGVNFGAYFTQSSGDIAALSAIELDTQKNSDGNVGGMVGSDLFISNNGAGTVGSFTGYNVNTDNEGTISGDVMGLNIGHLFNSGTVGGNTIGMRVQNPNGAGSTAGYGAGLEIQSFAGIGSTANYGIHVDDQGVGASDYAIKVEGGKSSFSDLFVRPDFTFGIGDADGVVGFFCTSSSSLPTCYMRSQDGANPHFEVTAHALGGTNHGTFETEGNFFTQTGHDGDPSIINVNDAAAGTGATGLSITVGSSSGSSFETGLSISGDGGFLAVNTAGDIHAGAVRSDKLSTTTNCASSGGTCGSASSGAVSITAAATTVTVATTAVTSSSRIFITENSTVGGALGVTCNTTVSRTYAVSTITNGTSFVITSSAAPAANPACIQFFIVN